MVHRLFKLKKKERWTLIHILERLEKARYPSRKLSQDGSTSTVHNEKLDKQDRIDAVLFEKVEKLHECVEQRSKIKKDVKEI